MTDDETDEPIRKPPPKGCLKGCVLPLLVVLGIVGFFAYGGRRYMHRVGTRELEQTTARLDAEDPGWQLDAIQAARLRAAPPPDRDAALAVLRLHDAAQEDWDRYRKYQHTRHWAWDPVTNRTPSFSELVWLAGARGWTADIRAAARNGLVDKSEGHYPLEVKDNPYMILLPHLDKARGTVDLLQYDALLAALEGDPDRGLRAARAALNVGRSIGDEPTMISQLTRMSCGRVAAQCALQVLAWSEPTDGELAATQAALLAEADVRWFLLGVRGDRAMLDKLFEGLESGKITYDDIVMFGLQPHPVGRAGFVFYKGLLPGDHAMALRLLTEYAEAAKLPPHEQRAAFARVPRPPRPPEDFRYVITNLLLPACEKVGQAGIRVRAELLTAVTAIACERYRLRTGRWPKSLAEIPPDILAAVPLDPFDGQPLRYERFPDGPAVYSVGDGDADAARRRREVKDPVADLGTGWRLWDPDRRRHPPEWRPPAPPEGEPAPDGP